MVILMDIDGWQKEAEVSHGMVKGGRISVLVSKPLAMMVRPTDQVPKPDGIEIYLYHRGRKINGMLVFERA